MVWKRHARFANCRCQKTQPSAHLQKIKLLTVRYCLPILKSTDTTSIDSLISPRPPPHPLLHCLAEKKGQRSGSERPLSISAVPTGNRVRSAEKNWEGHRGRKDIHSERRAQNFPLHRVRLPTLIMAVHIPATAKGDDYLLRSNGKQTGKISSVYNAGDILRLARSLKPDSRIFAGRCNECDKEYISRARFCVHTADVVTWRASKI